MSDRGKALVQDIGLRACGLVGLMAGDGAIGHLCRLAPQLRGHEATPAQLLLAASGFLAGSAGAGLLALGRHIFDPVGISA